MDTKSTPKRGKKEGFLSLFSCGSGKKKHGKHVTAVPPVTPPESYGATGSFLDEGNASKEVIEVKATPGHAQDNVEEEISYTDLKVVGKGTFGIVYRAKLCETGELIAIKKVFDDKRYKNRELFFMRQLDHPNINNLRYFFYCGGEGCRLGERYLNMVLEYVPETLFSVTKCDGLYTKPLLEPLYIKIYMYQVLRCLNYMHSLSICHRDIKPQNLLLNPENHSIKLCDFGSAKELLKNESNIAYICSRYYRAPELIFGAKDYTCQIDVWSAGCVMAELFQGHPIFPGANGPDQIVEIIKVLGTPTVEDMQDINHNCREMRFPPQMYPLPWPKVFTKRMPSDEALDLISRLFVYSPSKRILPLDACAHPFFDEIRRRGIRLRNGRPLPPLFNFTEQEIIHTPTIKDRLMPAHLTDGTEELDDSYVEPVAPSNELESPSSHEEGGIKNRIMKLARDSFRRKSSQKEKRKSEEVANETGQLDEMAKDKEDPMFELDADHETSLTQPDFDGGLEKGQTGQFDESENIPTEDIEALEIEPPKSSKKKKGKKKSKRMNSTEGDSAVEENEVVNPITSTPSGKSRKDDDDSPPPPPPPQQDDDQEDTVDMSSHKFSTRDGNLEAETATKKVVKKKKKKTKVVNGIQQSEVTETVVLTKITSKNLQGQKSYDYNSEEYESQDDPPGMTNI